MPRNTFRRNYVIEPHRWASMRPRRNAAEYLKKRNFTHISGPASMRPRRNAAEYRPKSGRIRSKRVGFNEAAA